MLAYIIHFVSAGVGPVLFFMLVSPVSASLVCTEVRRRQEAARVSSWAWLQVTGA